MREGAPICRWITPEDFALDVMPVSGEVLGFTNRWYESALAQATPFDLGEGLVILIPTAPVFLGTKWEAFASRGERDFLAGHGSEESSPAASPAARLAQVPQPRGKPETVVA